MNFTRIRTGPDVGLGSADEVWDATLRSRLVQPRIECIQYASTQYQLVNVHFLELRLYVEIISDIF